MKWRVIGMETMDAYRAMAYDEACVESVQAGGPPTIRFWTWRPSAVSIGYFQSLEDEVNVTACREQGVNIVRRRTGGGAVYHDAKREFTYSVICPEEMVSKRITESYRIICDWIRRGLWNLGIESSFHPINDILAGGKKISGNAQTRRGGVLHQHGTILYDLDLETMFTLLKVSDEKLSDKVIESMEERVTSVKGFREVPLSGAYHAILQGFIHGKDWAFCKWLPSETEAAERLALQRYASRDWTYLR